MKVVVEGSETKKEAERDETKERKALAMKERLQVRRRGALTMKTTMMESMTKASTKT